MTILITGANGQLGTELQQLLDENNITYHATDSKEMDITKIEEIHAYFERIKPTLVFHCAAYTAVDKAEEEGKELNQLINVEGTKNIAQVTEKYGATLVYISTDYVFDGTKKAGEYEVNDTPNPQNEYGRAKYEGELAVQEFSSKFYIIRTSWVFGKYGHNFVFTMQKLAESHPKITVVNDQFGRPTWTRSLAEFMLFVTNKQADYGIYHFSNDNSCTWYDFAKEILKEQSVEIQPVDSTQFPQKAKRPQYSVLDLSKTKALGYEIPTWEEALAGMLKAIQA